MNPHQPRGHLHSKTCHLIPPVDRGAYLEAQLVQVLLLDSHFERRALILLLPCFEERIGVPVDQEMHRQGDVSRRLHVHGDDVLQGGEVHALRLMMRLVTRCQVHYPFHAC